MKSASPLRFSSFRESSSPKSHISSPRQF